MGRVLLVLTASVNLADCSVSDPTRYYTLGRAAAGSAESRANASTARSSVAGTGTVGVGVGPVIMPGYLDRTMIVTRIGADQVDLSMYHRWAEPLEDGIVRILAEAIAVRVPTARIVMFPWRGSVARAIQ